MEPVPPSLRGAADEARAGIDDLRSLAEGLEGPARENAARLAERLEKAALAVESAVGELEGDKQPEVADAGSNAVEPASEKPEPEKVELPKIGVEPEPEGRLVDAPLEFDSAQQPNLSPISVLAPGKGKQESGEPGRRRHKRRRRPEKAEATKEQPEEDSWSTVELGRNAEEVSALSGHTASFAVAEILGFLSSLRKSGTLHVNGQHERFLIELRLGEVVYAFGNNPPPELRLGQILVSQGSLLQSELDQILASSGGSMLGRKLLESGRIQEEAMRIALGFQAQHVFHRLYSTRDAAFTFKEGEHADKLNDIQLNVTHLLLESARNLDERTAKVDEELSWLDG